MEEILRSECGKAPSLPLPRLLSPHLYMLTHLEALQALLFYMSMLLYCDPHIRSMINSHFQPCFPLMWQVTGNSKLLLHGLLFLVTSLHSGATQSLIFKIECPQCATSPQFTKVLEPCVGMGKKPNVAFPIINRNIIGALQPHRSLGFLQSTHRPQNSSFSTFLNITTLSVC